MSVPAPRQPRQGNGRWETIRYALDSNARTLRLCLILLVTRVAPVTAAVVAVLSRHPLLCGSPRGWGVGKPAVTRYTRLREPRPDRYAGGLCSSASIPSSRSDLASTVSIVPCDSSSATASTSLLTWRSSAISASYAAIPAR